MRFALGYAPECAIYLDFGYTYMPEGTVQNDVA